MFSSHQRRRASVYSLSQETMQQNSLQTPKRPLLGFQPVEIVFNASFSFAKRRHNPLGMSPPRWHLNNPWSRGNGKKSSWEDVYLLYNASTAPISGLHSGMCHIFTALQLCKYWLNLGDTCSENCVDFFSQISNTFSLTSVIFQALTIKTHWPWKILLSASSITFISILHSLDRHHFHPKIVLPAVSTLL